MRELFLGTVQVNRQTRQPGDMAGNGPIRLADSTHKFAELICWLWHDGKLVADRNILKDVSFSRLDEANLCWGADVTIDGMLFQARLLRGERFGEFISDEFTEFWNTYGSKMITEEQLSLSWTLTAVSDERMALFRGGNSCGTDMPMGLSLRDRSKGIGYRPVLIPQGLNPKRAHTALGKKVILYGPDGIVIGNLKTVGDYELELVVPEDTRFEDSGFDGFACDIGDRHVVVDRGQVQCIQLLQNRPEIKP
ncbi:hypothetical protein [Flavonifractor plautii]|jgi:hypothetical protein|uniref:Uncharacterized protein n=1 Tax=Flavonifractor plautii TaxID=292800 RepID=A0A6I2R175_FLAPL|nr:hypothetical protein [Flavonifractor plautii]MSB19985.1 hypothetical protein [Flavonifractor plautii]MSB83611.1 hypothetical protein [Flavonifractor plautii]GBF71133.1 hypothetical protein LAWASA_3888 [Lawsonibacter asaccharolyticus]